jgi:predicted alpha/beta-hydrolase family hydrolase
VPEIEIDTPHGLARVHLTRVRGARGAVLLGHGAGGGVGAPDLQAAAEAAQAHKFSVGLVEQPYRVAGRRSPARAPQLDAAWMAIVDRLRARELRGRPLIFGGRSMGARVACRTAPPGGAVGVVCLAFPLLPPRRAKATKAPESRLPELDSVPVPTLVIQGVRDQFGMPPAGAHREVVQVTGDHSLRTGLAAISETVGAWLDRLIVDAGG